jgi:hypothetical protein
MKLNAYPIFDPVAGAIFDVESLQAIRAAEHRALSTIAKLHGGESVLSGFEPVGLQPATRDYAPSLRLVPRGGVVRLSSGTAWVRAHDGLVYAVETTTDLECPPCTGGSLVLGVRVEQEHASNGARLARAQVQVEAAWVAGPASGLVLFTEAPAPDTYWTDVNHRLHPSSDLIGELRGIMATVLDACWDAPPAGNPWTRRRLGRAWERYQTAAASAVYSADAMLATQTLSTAERARLLSAVYAQLTDTVESAAVTLRDRLCPRGVGPYRDLWGTSA